jgi:hypothetical protein
MRVYQCAEGACVGNNTCNGNRTGLLCGYCAPGYALELQVCTKCSSSDNVLKTLTTFLIALGVLLVLLILFLTGWREVAVGNYVHRGYDKLIGALNAGIRKMLLVISMKDKAETEYGEIEKFLNDPIVHKLLAQGAKIAIGLDLCSSLSRSRISVYCLTDKCSVAAYLQVMRSFFNFKIVWPQMIQDALAILVQLSILVSFDFLQWPGFGCLTQFPYDAKVYVGRYLI